MSDTPDKAPIDMTKRRRDSLRAELADEVLTDLGAPGAEELAGIVGEAPAELRTAVVEALERQGAYRRLAELSAQQDKAEGIPPDRCCNMPCPEYQQVARREVQEDGSLASVGATDFCKRGAEYAQGCMFRTTEMPPTSLDRLPSHAEAVRMLQRAGLLQPDDFGHWNGTDFAQRRATHRLWWAYVRLLVESGKIGSGNEADDAMRQLGFSPPPGAIPTGGAPMTTEAPGTMGVLHRMHEALGQLGVPVTLATEEQLVAGVRLALEQARAVAPPTGGAGDRSEVAGVGVRPDEKNALHRVIAFLAGDIEEREMDGGRCLSELRALVARIATAEARALQATPPGERHTSPSLQRLADDMGIAVAPSEGRGSYALTDAERDALQQAVHHLAGYNRIEDVGVDTVTDHLIAIEKKAAAPPREPTETQGFRAGDIVRHKPSGEEWLLAVDEDERGWVRPCGWPPTMADAAHCVLIARADEPKRIKMLNEWASQDRADSRARAARAQLDKGAPPEEAWLKLNRAEERLRGIRQLKGASGIEEMVTWLLDALAHRDINPDNPEDTP